MEADTRIAVSVTDLLYEVVVTENVPNPLFDPAKDAETTGYYGARPRQPQFIQRRVTMVNLTREEFDRMRAAILAR